MKEVEDGCLFGAGLFGAEVFAELDDVVVGVRKKGGKGVEEWHSEWPG